MKAIRKNKYTHLVSLKQIFELLNFSSTKNVSKFINSDQVDKLLKIFGVL